MAKVTAVVDDSGEMRFTATEPVNVDDLVYYDGKVVGKVLAPPTSSSPVLVFNDAPEKKAIRKLLGLPY